MRIYADMRCLQDRAYAFRGIGFHAAALLRQTQANFAEAVELIGIVDERLEELPPEYRALVASQQYAASPQAGEAPAIFLQLSPMTHDPAHVAAFLGRSRILAAAVVYDFIPLDEPRYLPTASAHRAYLSRLLWLKHYPLFFPISQYTRRRLREVVGVPEDRSVVTGACLRGPFADFDPANGNPTQLRCPFPPRKYFLLVGGGDPRKNVEGAVVAHAQLFLRTGLKTGLVIAGNYQQSQREELGKLFAQQGGDGQLLKFVSDLSDAELAALYHHALATICPSKMEGFSLPVVEAVACGSPVLASDCEAQRELVQQPEALFPAEDAGALCRAMENVLGSPTGREQLLAQQQGLAEQFREASVAGRLWQRVLHEYRRWQSRRPPAGRPSKPRLAFLSPYPPDRSGVADYTLLSLPSLARHATIDVFTDTQGTKPEPFVNQFHRLTELPYLVDDYDRVIAVVGNSLFHTKIIDYHGRYGGPCVAHDSRMADLYWCWRGPEQFTAMASRLLRRAVTVAEAETWIAEPHRLPTLFLHDIAAKADPLIVHSRGMQAEIAKHYGKHAVYLPFSIMRQFSDAELADEVRAKVRHRLNLAPDRLAIATFGLVGPAKAPRELLAALELLLHWGVPADLYFVGTSQWFRVPLQECIDRLKLHQHVHLMDDWVSPQLYRDFLIAADFAVQLRDHGFGAVSAALSDCCSAGLPAVANQGLADAIGAPEYILRVPDNLSPVLIAEQLANAYTAGRHRTRLSSQRDVYVQEHHYDRYAVQLMQALGLS